MVMRGGSSKGAYFVEEDLPADPAERDSLLLRIMGTPDPRQIDGIGGAHPLTSKVAIIAPSATDGVDVEYLFLQLGVEDELVSDRQNCGNLLAGVAPFAVERGLVRAEGSGPREVRVLMRNTGAIATASIAVRDGLPVYVGPTAISGVPGTASPIRLDFEDVAGGSCGALLPTGNRSDTIDGVACTLIDNGMPVVVMLASDLGVDGSETPADLEANEDLRTRLESIRLAAGPLMNLGDVADTTVPKLTMVSAPRTDSGDLCTRTFIPHRCHDAIGVLGAVSVATAAVLPGTPAADLLAGGADGSIVLEHPTGSFEAAVSLRTESATPIVERAGIIRTARKLIDGIVFPRDY
ncbi:MAG: 4-oxalomesaconate tautomerase [Actinomycetota bacterium]